MVLGNERPIIAGHSHLISFRPLKTSDSQLALLPALDAMPFDILSGPWPRDAGYWEGVVDHAVRGHVVLVWQGNQHNVQFLFAPNPSFDFVLSSRPYLPIDEALHVVPELAVRELFKGSLTGLREIVARIRRIRAVGGVTLMATPPPKGDNERIRDYLARERHFVDAARKMNADLSKISLSEPLLRLKLWHVLNDMIKEIAVQHSCRFLGCPPDACDDQGFLKPDYWRADATHANERYGKLALEFLSAELDSNTSP